MRHLRAILKIKWQDKISNIEVLERSRCSSIEAMIISAQLRWVGLVVRMADDRIPKQLLDGELAHGKRSHGRQKKRFKDTLKHNMIKCNIDPSSFKALAADSLTDPCGEGQSRIIPCCLKERGARKPFQKD